MDFWRFSGADVDPSALLHGAYDPRLVFLSFVVASIAAYTALEIIERVSGAPTARASRWWLLAGSLCMGLGVWAMHFIGMLAFSLPVATTYELWTTMVSVLPAVVASAVTIRVLSQPLDRVRLLAGGGLMAIGIGTMHFTGMEGMRMDAVLYYDPGLFVTSILVAFVLATAAFWAEARLRPGDDDDRFVSLLVGAVVLGGAVCGMHYTAMKASLFYADPSVGSVDSMVFSPFALSVAILVVTTLILAVAVGGTWIDRRLQRAWATIERLEGLLPICAWCKKIRGDDGSWMEIEVYVRSSGRAEVTHGICATCADEM